MGAIAKSLKSGDILFSEGQQSKSMFLIQKGVLSIRVSRGSGQVELARVRAKEVVGELSFFDRHARSATAVAVTAVDVLELPFEDLDKAYNEIPDYMKTIMASVADRLRKADETIRKLQANTIRDSSGSNTDDQESED